MKKEIITTKIAVKKQGAQVYFTIGLPQDLLCVEKISTGIMGMATTGQGRKIARGALAGTLQLQGMEEPNICYTTDIIYGMGRQDETLLGFVDDWIEEPLMTYAVMPFTGGHKHEPEHIRFNNNYMLYGCYRDEVGLRSGQDIAYTISVYLHLVYKNEEVL